MSLQFLHDVWSIFRELVGEQVLVLLLVHELNASLVVKDQSWVDSI